MDKQDTIVLVIWMMATAAILVALFAFLMWLKVPALRFG